MIELQVPVFAYSTPWVTQILLY